MGTNFGRVLALLRKEKGISQKEAAADLEAQRQEQEDQASQAIQEEAAQSAAPSASPAQR